MLHMHPAWVGENYQDRVINLRCDSSWLVGWLILALFSRSRVFGWTLTVQCGGSISIWYSVVDERRDL